MTCQSVAFCRTYPTFVIVLDKFSFLSVMDMSRKTPLVTDSCLDNLADASTIMLDTPDWFDWLKVNCTFRFAHSSGGFTARKEQKQRGQRYWVAYRQVQNKLYKTYLGKTETLTGAHLCAASLTLAQAAEEYKP